MLQANQDLMNIILNFCTNDLTFLGNDILSLQMPAESCQLGFKTYMVLCTGYFVSAPHDTEVKYALVILSGPLLMKLRLNMHWLFYQYPSS